MDSSFAIISTFGKRLQMLCTILIGLIDELLVLLFGPGLVSTQLNIRIRHKTLYKLR